MAEDNEQASGVRLVELFAQLSMALDGMASVEPACARYLERLVPVLKTAELRANPPLTETIAPAQSWAQLFPDELGWRSNAQLATIHDIGLAKHWFRADKFYPEPALRSFSEHVWGLAIAGEDGALFDSGGAFIALLIVIDAHTTYPLHAHRIEELYYVLAGEGQWSRDGEHWETVPPGSVFHNRSNQAHSMRTADHPVVSLGLYLPPFGWEGGLLDADGKQCR